MHLSIETNIIPWIIHYKYLVIFPITVVEGPIITIISGFLASLGYLSFWITFPIIIVGDLLGDSICYAIGRFGRRGLIQRYGHYIGMTMDRLEKMERYFEKHRNKTLIFGKFAHGTGSLMWIATGLAKMPFKIFFVTNFYTTAIKSFILILIGFYFGRAYKSFDNYFDYAATTFVTLLIVLYIAAIKTNLLNRFFKFDE